MSNEEFHKFIQNLKLPEKEKYSEYRNPMSDQDLAVDQGKGEFISISTKFRPDGNGLVNSATMINQTLVNSITQRERCQSFTSRSSRVSEGALSRNDLRFSRSLSRTNSMGNGVDFRRDSILATQDVFQINARMLE